MRGVYIVSGTSFYGDHDRVPGLFHVAAKCFHIYHVPLIPLGTYLVFDGTEREERSAWWRSTTRTTVQAVPLRFSVKPLLWAWTRLACWLAVIVGLGSSVAATAAASPLASLPYGIPLVVGGAAAILGFRRLGSPRFRYLPFLLLGAGLGIALYPLAEELHSQTWHALGVLGLPVLFAVENASIATRHRAMALAHEAGLSPKIVTDHFNMRPSPVVPPPAARVVAERAAAPRVSAPLPVVPSIAPPPAPAQPPPAPGEQPRLLR